MIGDIKTIGQELNLIFFPTTVRLWNDSIVNLENIGVFQSFVTDCITNSYFYNNHRDLVFHTFVPIVGMQLIPNHMFFL